VVQAPPPVVAQPVQAVAARPAYDQSNCREYTSTITVAGQPSQQVGTACQQPDGSWRIVN
jgi:surface antigen